jgi:PEP-CTERM motif
MLPANDRSSERYTSNNSKERIMRKFRGIALVLALAVTCEVGNAMADTITYTIDTPGSGLSGYTGPYATVTVNLVDSTNATITFNSSTTAGITYLMGSAGAADINVNATSWNVTGLSGTVLSGFTNGTLSDTGSGTVGGFGAFNQTFQNFDGYVHSHDSITFTLTDTSGTWANASNVLTANAQGAYVAIHGFACTAPCDSTAGALTTGFAANGGAVNTPEPASLMLVGGGLAGIGIWRRKIA